MPCPIVTTETARPTNTNAAASCGFRRRSASDDVWSRQRVRHTAPPDRPATRRSRVQPMRALPGTERLLECVGRADAGLEREIRVGFAALERRPRASVDPDAEIRHVLDLERHLEANAILDHR